MNDREGGSYVVLRIVVSDRAVSLRPADIIRERKGRSGGCLTYVRGGVISRRPSKLGEIVTGQNRSARVHEPAGCHIEIEDNVRREGMIQVDGKQLRVVIFGASIEAQTGAKRIRRKIQQAKVGKATKEPSVRPDILGPRGLQTGLYSRPNWWPR